MEIYQLNTREALYTLLNTIKYSLYIINSYCLNIWLKILVISDRDTCKLVNKNKLRLDGQPTADEIHVLQ